MNTKEHPYAFTGRFNMFRGRIVSEIVICSPDDADLVSTRIRALWDTGCSQSIISKRVADFLRLQPDNKQQLRSPFGGTAICDVAKIRLFVVLGGIRILIDAAINTKPNSDPDCDITLGLDFDEHVVQELHAICPVKLVDVIEGLDLPSILAENL